METNKPGLQILHCSDTHTQYLIKAKPTIKRGDFGHFLENIAWAERGMKDTVRIKMFFTLIKINFLTVFRLKLHQRDIDGKSTKIQCLDSKIL